MRVFLHGKDNVGWSIDQDRRYTQIFLNNLGHEVVSNFFRSDMVHSVWWSMLMTFMAYPLRYKKIIAVASNDIDIGDGQFKKAREIVDLWVVPNKGILDRLRQGGVDAKYQPFYVDENVFYSMSNSKKTIAAGLGIDYNKIKNKLIISSFQRDSLGSDLERPKWQKNPALLVNILTGLPSDKYVLLLAGPRRHWIIRKCRDLKIPYVFVGQEPDVQQDDIAKNILSLDQMNMLYNLSDINVITSINEGGPKAVIEATYAHKLVLSTKVGLAPDFLDDWCLYEGAEEATAKIEEIIKGKELTSLINHNYRRTSEIVSFDATLARWAEIYEYFRHTYL